MAETVLEVPKTSDIGPLEPGQKVTIRGTNGANVAPERRQAAIDLFARGVPLRNICEGLGMDHRTLTAILNNYAPELAQIKSNLQRKFYLATVASVESAHNRANEGKATAIDAKLLADTLLTLHGEAAQISEFRITLPEFEKLRGELVTSKVPTIDAESVPLPKENEQQGIAPADDSEPLE